MRSFSAGTDNAGDRSAGSTSRRQFLHLMAAAGVAAGGGMVLSACSKGGSGGGGDVVLKLADAPYSVMPSRVDRKSSVSARAYGDTLQVWLDKNPNVRLKHVNIDIWTQDVMVTAVTGGTAPAIYSSNALGGWDQTAILAAFRQGLGADVTSLLQKSQIIDKLADYCRPVWESMWKVDGKYYGVPSGYGVSDGMFYRRDLIEEAGLEAPSPDWTWWDVRRYAKALTSGHRKGWGTPNWGLAVALGSDGFSFLSQIPAPDTSYHWQWDYLPKGESTDLWVSGVENWRGMMFEDKSMISDVSYDGWDQVVAAFRRQDIAIQPGNVDQYTEPADSDTSLLHLAKRLDKPVWDVVGWMTYPLGKYGEYPDRRSYMSGTSFSPDLDDDALSEAFSLYQYMTEVGFVRQKKMVYEDSKDLHGVWSVDGIVPLLAGTREQLPGAPEDAWGKDYVAQVERAAQRSIVPEISSYIPPDDQTVPGQAVDDAMSKWMFDPSANQVRPVLTKLNATRNKQAQSFSSQVSKEDFIKGAKEYYAAQNTFWQQDAPDFYDHIFKGWYEGTILPALGEA